MKIEIEIPEGYMLDGYTVKPVPVPLFNWQPYQPYIFPQVPQPIAPFFNGGSTGCINAGGRVVDCD